MILAKVIGHVVATQKCQELSGSNLLMVTALGDDLNPLKDRTYVAVDSVGAGINDIVLVEEYLALNKDKYKAMSVVAIVEKVYRDGRE
ncbi:Carbon dioxide concentrating mechanism protein CcmL [Providencia rustigianii]|uniref:Ethanolamine utilization protein EutN/carboxysome structural protein Ccml n=2 Tax=Providencia rustigianii TaxID=158850 RepID=D1P2A2_9GAMM|nr:MULTISPECIES: EutN/CcmL family microcompartment protein [Providencia]EFB72257.1 ethanolamine utilization protein EutN/carboxysome structural protein Ccml [Providencia rustigianii DSM 4541]MTC55952.1 ethanolamine utilization protein EutN [Providencia rustigianii]MTC61442.1 ethanolamine utilization protein EutN [Providencia rustigianii]SPY79017.1 Carbon dioxide concentrating mechanism protein CcmL [Providencia rustigianii]SUC28627.1 Carbon dioxide concentrating mechanism protein CcmL [Provide